MFDNFITVAKEMTMPRLEESSRCFHTAFILRRSNIISIGVNAYKKTHPLNLKYRYHPLKNGTCAELVAVIKGRLTDYTGHDMVVVRIDRNGNPAQSRPCAGCEFLINQLNFRKVWFTNDYGQFEQLF